MTAYKKSSELLTTEISNRKWKWHPRIELCIGIKTNKISSKETGKMHNVENEQISHESRGINSGKGLTIFWAPICKQNQYDEWENCCSYIFSNLVEVRTLLD